MHADSGLETLIAWLEERHAQVFAEEDAAKSALASGDKEGYSQHMHAKAELLARMALDAKASLWSVQDEEKRALIARRLQKFSAAAAYGLRIDSLFFMSALLYRDEHPVGDPDNLRVYIESLKAGNLDEDY